MNLKRLLNSCLRLLKGSALLLLGVWTLSIYAQQDPQISQFTLNKMMYNPGFTGIDDVTSVTSLIRNQWVSLDGHPVTRTISIDAPIPTGGVGIMLNHDGIGTESILRFRLNYAFRLMFADKSSFSIGISGGFNQFKLDGSLYRAPGGTYENGTVEHNDPNVPGNVASDLTPDFDFGIYYTRNDVYGGISVTHLLEPKNQIDAVTTNYKRNIYFVTGLNRKMSELVMLRPSILFKTEFAKAQIDLNCNVVYDNDIWVGASYRGITKTNNDALVLMAGMNVTNQFIVGYSYDIHTSSIGRYSSGTHEFVLNYKILGWGIYQGAKLIYCPRFL